MNFEANFMFFKNIFSGLRLDKKIGKNMGPNLSALFWSSSAVGLRQLYKFVESEKSHDKKIGKKEGGFFWIFKQSLACLGLGPE